MDLQKSCKDCTESSHAHSAQFSQLSISYIMFVTTNVTPNTDTLLLTKIHTLSRSQRRTSWTLDRELRMGRHVAGRVRKLGEESNPNPESLPVAITRQAGDSLAVWVVRSMVLSLAMLC